MLASRVWVKDVITLLGENGADASLIDREGNNALYYLVRSLYAWDYFWNPYPSNMIDLSRQLTQYLLSKGASINQKGNSGTALMYVASQCKADATKYLLSLGADPHVKTKLGETALSIVEKMAVTSPQGSTCNQTYSILSEPEKYRMAYSDRTMPLNQAGGIQDNKGAQPNPVQAVGNFLNGLNKILGAPPQH